MIPEILVEIGEDDLPVAQETSITVPLGSNNNPDPILLAPGEIGLSVLSNGENSPNLRVPTRAVLGENDSPVGNSSKGEIPFSTRERPKRVRKPKINPDFVYS